MKRNTKGVWVALANVRDENGAYHQVTRQAQTRVQAVARLHEAIDSRPGFAAARRAREARGAQHRVEVTSAPFEDPTRSKPHVVYRFYDTRGELLYVGISLAGVQRLGQHRSSKDWFVDVARTEFTHYPDYESAREAERVAIANESPRYNIAA